MRAPWLLLALLGRAAAQYEAQVLVEPTVDPNDIQTEVTKFAGDGRQVAGLTDGQGEGARFDGPSGGVMLGSLLVVSDVVNHAIRQVTPEGEVSTLAR